MKKTTGFTLIELLLVLAIIGIISAIAIPALLGQRVSARNTRTHSQCASFQGAAQVALDQCSLMASQRTATDLAALPDVTTIAPVMTQVLARTEYAVMSNAFFPGSVAFLAAAPARRGESGYVVTPTAGGHALIFQYMIATNAGDVLQELNKRAETDLLP